MTPASYRLVGRTSPDEAAEPRVMHFQPCDAAGRKCGDIILGTMSSTRAAKFELGVVVKSLPAMGEYVAPTREPAE